MLYKDLKTDIIINQKVVRGFQIKRGVIKGDALSCILFIMCMELLVGNIENNKVISALRSRQLNSDLPKSYAYADDVNVILEAFRPSLMNMNVSRCYLD